MIDNPLPSHWRELQDAVCRLFNDIGLVARTNVPIETPRGTVNLDVFATDENSVDKIRYIVECKNWESAIPQSVVHSFTTVMHETGANIGFIVSKHGLQSGAEGYTKNTNIVGLTYADLQKRYFAVWWQRHFCARLAAASDIVHQYVEPLNSWREKCASKLSVQKKAHFHSLQRKYGTFAMLASMLNIGNVLPRYAGSPPDDIEQIKTQLKKASNDQLTFTAEYFRELLDDVCGKLMEAEKEFNAVFGKCIFDRG